MAVYRNVHISFWQDEDMLELTPEQKYFYLYLMTNSKTNQSGCYKISKKVMQFETGYNTDTLSKLLGYFMDIGKIGYCEGTQEVILYNWLKHNWSSSPKVKSCIEKNIQDIDNIEFMDWLINEINTVYGYSIDTVCIPKRNKNKHKQKEKTETEEPKPQSVKPDYISLFNKFWKLYPKKVDKKKTGKKYNDLLNDNNYSNTHLNIIEGLEDQINWRKQADNEDVFTPAWKNPLTWLNGECWNDELEEIKHGNKDFKKRTEFNNVALFPQSYKNGKVCIICDNSQIVNGVKCPCVNYDYVPLEYWDAWMKYYKEVKPISYNEYIKENS